MTYLQYEKAKTQRDLANMITVNLSNTQFDWPIFELAKQIDTEALFGRFGPTPPGGAVYLTDKSVAAMLAGQYGFLVAAHTKYLKTPELFEKYGQDLVTKLANDLANPGAQLV